MAFNTSTVARWTILSSSTGTPSGLCRPSVLAIYTLRTGFARYAPRFSLSERFWRFLSSSYPETLRVAYFSLKKEAAPGVDGETWRHYGEELERNLQNLSERLKRRAYRAKPVRRVDI